MGLAGGVLVSAWAGIDQLLRAVSNALAWEVPESLLEAIAFPFHVWLVIVCANIVSFTVGWIASLLLPNTSGRDPTGLTFFDSVSDAGDTG